MRHKFAKIVAVAASVACFAVFAAAAAVPPLRHAASGIWNSPVRLEALSESPQVRFESGAAAQARIVAQLLPDAVARVEAFQGRPFANPVAIGVYANSATFAAANGMGDPGPVGTTFLGNVALSPALFSVQRQRLPAILAHELSHAHLQSWMSLIAYLRVPNWFKEGLAVAASGGGGAEGVSEAQARDAIRRGIRIAIEPSGSVLNPAAFEFERPPVGVSGSFRIQLAYRQAALFVVFMRDTDPAAFARMMDSILEGRSFFSAVNVSFGADLPALWSRYVETIAN